MKAAMSPLVPADVDLRDFDYMPLYGATLLDSETWLLCNAEEKVAALTLWWKAWHQTPAGSLPNNQRLLASFAGYGVAVKAWEVVAPMVLRGWVECSDGRLYHRYLASRVAISWLGKVQRGWAKECDRIRKENKERAENKLEPKPVPQKPTIHSIGFPSEVTDLSDGNDGAFRRNGIRHPTEQTPRSVGLPSEPRSRSDGNDGAFCKPSDGNEQILPRGIAPDKGQGQGQGESKKDSDATASGASAPSTDPPTPKDQFWAVVRTIDDSKGFAGVAGRWLSLHDGDPVKALPGIEECVGKDNPKTWLTACIAKRKERPAISASASAPICDFDAGRQKWLDRGRSWLKSGFWLSAWGDAPDLSRTDMPADVRAELGIGVRDGGEEDAA